MSCVVMQQDDKRHEEFARAKQFRKLNKLLNTPAAKRPITLFRNFAIAVLTTLVVVQAVTFVADRVLLTRLNRYSGNNYTNLFAIEPLVCG